ncbi:family 43 glycosylhydrolase [Roseateles saccharophilus]|uniref:GH43 family beta-xylosidase n=1 Tax=Roseateles saccharophilus TaxID=304 RepID=A0A4R3UFJ4_ROSSA|nr:glycoside hydrolase family 43 protein [Roseateles saccharophilus]MDG0834833.1 alpha-N-arabinofuranosidase [Roseateles saccharophilus]TCU88956.1 GH43 family beta-xylosidase [Roseateles saccharophilus]
MSISWTNPLVEQRADPHLSRVDGRYWFTASVPSYDAIEIRSADSIAGLATATPKVIWRKHDSGPMSYHVWAPELHRIAGRWFVYFAASERGDIWKLRMYVLECSGQDPLRDAWVERGQILTPEEGFSLDATPFEHGGRHYLCWAQKSPPTESNLYLAELANPWTLKSAPVCISRPDLAWERIGFHVNEGPAVLKRHGRVFIAYSAAATDANYCMGLLWADEGANLLDRHSWQKSPLPVFRTNEAAGQFGPGHNSFTTTPDGRTDLIVYHARNYSDIVGDPLNDPNRHARVQALAWRADGFPDFGTPVADGLYTL